MKTRVKFGASPGFGTRIIRTISTWVSSVFGERSHLPVKLIPTLSPTCLILAPTRGFDGVSGDLGTPSGGLSARFGEIEQRAREKEREREG